MQLVQSFVSPVVLVALVYLAIPTTASDINSASPSPQAVKDCVQALYSPVNIYRVLAGSGLALESMGDWAQCHFTPDFHFCVLDMSGHTETQGLCLPNECTQEIIQHWWVEKISNTTDKEVQDWLNSTVLPVWDNACELAPDKKACDKDYYTFYKNAWHAMHVLREADGTVYCDTEERDTDMNAGGIIMLILCIVILFLAVTQFIVEQRATVQFSSEERQMLVINADATDRITESEKSRVMLMLQAFSVTRNMRELLESSPKRTLRCLDSMRAIAMFWIILGHTINFQLPGFVGLADYQQIPLQLQSWKLQFVASAAFCVDTFFILSGMLTAYVLIRKYRSTGKTFPLHLAVLMRYLRLTPLLAFVVGIYGGLFRYMGKGPLWFRFEAELENCKTNWWQNLLFINNFYPVHYDKQCIPWAWYLADDMQFFIVGMVIVWLYTKSPMVSYICTALLVACAIVAVPAIATHYNIDMVHGDSQDFLYDKPYARVTAYALGLVAAFLLALKQDKIKNMNSVLARVLLVASIAGLLLITYATSWFNWDSANPNWSHAGMLTYMTLSRVAWSVCLVVLVLVCVSGHGSFVADFLSLSFWEPLGRLTFAAYLIHPALIRLVYYQRTQLFNYTAIEFVAAYLGFLFAAYIVATALFVLIETPFAHLAGMLTGKK
eukprot:m.100441 g.100441  ORF g.100441 m.100441 type:complete len:665 (+) comp13172_c0_seq1:135-2129(+)